jgi:hypothetical protein
MLYSQQNCRPSDLRRPAGDRQCLPIVLSTRIRLAPAVRTAKGIPMPDVHRICPDCGGDVALNARHCPHCGADTQSGLPLEQSYLPAVVGKAALPVVAGLAGLALRTGWQLMRSRLAQAAARRAWESLSRPPAVSAPSPPSETIRRPRRTIHIRSSWTIGDASGFWRSGSQEQTIEIDDE